ncbi:MAG: hypothetical protein ETSY2_11460 [Candidatus Entotheonella gemina]|uniref:Uncharacterized protein n=2 Tax=Candidatus Entotheonella TaxID=93171 RepID=W4MB18_9BACT|nr:MAG: hypothetical protein ETSY2_11460 [Candidatus Entotheonella gemina]
MLTFPSLEWFEELVRLMNENEAAYRRLGYADVTWALEVQTTSPTQMAQLYRFVFEEYTCSEVIELEPGTDPDADFTLQATLDTWCEMIRNIQENQGPDLDHSLNKLALMDDPIYVAATDFLSRDLFARYGQTFQQFFNGAIHIPTEFAG